MEPDWVMELAATDSGPLQSPGPPYLVISLSRQSPQSVHVMISAVSFGLFATPRQRHRALGEFHVDVAAAATRSMIGSPRY